MSNKRVKKPRASRRASKSRKSFKKRKKVKTKRRKRVARKLKSPKRKIKKVRKRTPIKRRTSPRLKGQSSTYKTRASASSPQVRALAWVAGHGLSKDGLRCIHWDKCTQAQKTAMERLRREAFPGDRGDVTTCQEWSAGQVGPIPGLDIRDRPLLHNATNHTVMVAVKKKIAVGYVCWLDYKNWCNRRCTFLGYLAIKKTHRLQGIGRFLINQFTERGKRLNLEGVLNATHNARGFYAKMGWRMCLEETENAAPGFDMEDPEKIVGKQVRFKFKDKKWYLGKVKSFDGGPYYSIYVPSLPAQNLARYHVQKDISKITVLEPKMS